MSYEPHEALIEPARPTRSLRRLIAGSFTAIGFFLVLSLLYSELQYGALPEGTRDSFFDELATGTTPVSTLINLFLFVLFIVALWLALRLVHNRSLRGLIGPFALAWWQFKRVTWAIMALYVLLLLLPSPDGMQPAPNLEFNTWVLLLPFALIGLVIQVSAEELVFRGYLQSQMAARFSSPLIWICVPSVLFAILHYDAQIYDGYAWLVVIWAGAFGLAAADLTARSGTLGPAIALHLINNFSAILLVAPEGNFDGVALYTIPFSAEDADLVLAWMPVEMMILLCSWLTARIALRC